jgi:hypothetical protein
MKKLLKEFLWIIGFYLLLVTIKITLFPLDHPQYYGEIFIKVDKYNYFITNSNVVQSIFILGCFILYQLRTYLIKYKNPYSNFILVFSQILSIAQISFLISFVGSIKNSIAISDEKTIYINDVPTDLNWNLIFYVLLILQMAIACLLYYNAIRISKK